MLYHVRLAIGVCQRCGVGVCNDQGGKAEEPLVGAKTGQQAA